MFPVGGRLVAAYVTEFYAGLLDSVDCRWRFATSSPPTMGECSNGAI